MPCYLEGSGITISFWELIMTLLQRKPGRSFHELALVILKVIVAILEWRDNK